MNIVLVRCSHKAYAPFAQYHYDSDTFNKSAVCYIAMMDGKQIGFCASITGRGRWGNDLRPARFAHKTVCALPVTHSAYFKLWAAIADAHAEMLTRKGFRFWSQAPSDHAAYRDLSPFWKKSSTKKVGYRSHQYIGHRI